MFPQINPRQSFPNLENEILAYWDENKTFQRSLDIRKGGEEFSFYDGPPFATGTPHYGHLLGGTLKDIIPRYQTMKGKYVERRFGWDCHGLPIENIVEKKLGISGKKDIEERIGVHQFNEECRSNVFGYVEDWRRVVRRIGRWIDMDNDYKTMDADFMESVWWVFGQLYSRGLIYERDRVVPYCPRCATPLANFEVNQGYEMKQDKAATVKFRVVGDSSRYILAWTTTPWTLPANLGLAVGEGILYSEVLDKASGDTYILASERLSSIYKNTDDYSVVRECSGSSLAGMRYEPLYSDWQHRSEFPKGMSLGDKSYSVVVGHHVTTESGTGIVHIAPAYGEDDNLIGINEKLGYVAHINSTGNTEHLSSEYSGVFVFDLSDLVLRDLKDRSLLVHVSTIDHSYPHCYRCKTPLIYRGISAWYVHVESLREKMLEGNSRTNWTPEHIKDGRFGKWLEGARDWNISRNRYWGSAIPVWKTADESLQVCISSREELYRLNKPHKDITKFIFVRHGRTDYNEQGLQDSLNKAHLSPLGHTQAAELINLLAHEGVSAIYSSPFDRCHETITPFAQSVGLTIRDDIRLQECQKPSWQDQKVPCMSHWNDNAPGDETIEQVYDRVGVALEEIMKHHPGETVVVVSHGDPLMLAQMYLDGVKGESYKKYKAGSAYPLNKGGASEMIKIRYTLQKTKRSIDIHKHFMDDILLSHPETGEEMRRVSEVLDCWFESGSMPYAQKHYPFENKAQFDQTFPAEFICEGLDQTRGWFYTLMVLSTALFDSEPFKNVIVNGLILAEDGKKMAKSLKNYPDPELIFEEYGADALRFYMLSSQATRGEDLRFSKQGVEEVVKSVLLPLWNTYSFFTTYANIDTWEPFLGSLTLVRHAQSEANASGRVSDSGVDVHLTDLGRDQALKTAERFVQQGRVFDRIIVTPSIRTSETAEIIRSHLGLDHIPLEICNGLQERSAGEFSALTLEQMQALDPNVTGVNYFTQALAYGAESWEIFDERVSREIRLLEERARSGERILIIAHGGTGRVVGQSHFGRSSSDMLRLTNAEAIDIPLSPLKNPLDIWMRSRLQVTIAEVSDALDSYMIARATSSLVSLIDDITNFYVRRSRKRFWGPEMTPDKSGAYETLHQTLVVVTQLLAPIAPFISEAIYRGLTSKESVHLSSWPSFARHEVHAELNKEIAEVRRAIRLGLSLRSQKKIRVRQPLSRVTLSASFDTLALDIIKEELNVVDILLVDPQTLAREVVKIDAKLLGPKFGKGLQEIIKAGKAGEFEDIGENKIIVATHILHEGEYTRMYEPYDSSLDIAGEAGLIVSLDTHITPELEREGYARDVIRAVQDMRKEMDYHVMDRIALSITSDIDLSLWQDLITRETLADLVSHRDVYDLSRDISLGESLSTISLARI